MTDRMTPAEAVALCRFAKACCPQQAFDEYTPDAWFELLRDLRFNDCKEAIVYVVKGQPFVSPAEIRGHIRHIRHERIVRFGHISPPSGMFREDMQDFHLEMAWVKEVRDRVADGELTREQWNAEQASLGHTGNRALPSGYENTFRRIDGGGDAT